MCIQTDPSGLPRIAGLAERFPKVQIVLDHLGRPDVTDGPPYERAASLFSMAAFENIFLKLTPRIFADVRRGKASPESFFPRLIELFGSARVAWGSNFPASEGGLKDNLARARASLACLPQEDQAFIFSGTAQRLYPALVSTGAASAAGRAPKPGPSGPN
jgi:predicted TIM-barrel fold metal-dependent hydrolase